MGYKRPDLDEFMLAERARNHPTRGNHRRAARALRADADEARAHGWGNLLSNAAKEHEAAAATATSKRRKGRRPSRVRARIRQAQQRGRELSRKRHVLGHAHKATRKKFVIVRERTSVVVGVVYATDIHAARNAAAAAGFREVYVTSVPSDGMGLRISMDGGY